MAGMTTTAPTATAARRAMYTALLEELTVNPTAEYLAHEETMAPLGYTRERLLPTWAARAATLAHPIEDADWQIVPKTAVCRMSGLSWEEAKRRGAFEAVDVPGVACNMTTRDAIVQWCQEQGITPAGYTSDADRRLAARAEAYVRLVERALGPGM